MCGETFSSNDFTKHFGGCQQFKAEFKEFDSKFGELLKAYSEPKEKLLIVRFLLKLYIAVIEKKLKKYYDNINRENPAGINNMNPPPVHFPNPANENANLNNNSNNNNNVSQFSNPSNIIQQGLINQSRGPQQSGYSNPINQPGNVNPPGIIQNPWQKKNSNEVNPNPNPQSYPNFNPKPEEINQKINMNQNPPKNDFDDDFEPQPELKEEDNSNLCMICKINPNILYLECVHPICYECFEKEAKKNLFEMACKVCNKPISEQLKKDVLQDKFENLEKIALMKDNMTEIAEEVRDLVIVDEKGKPLTGGDEERRYFEDPWLFKKGDTYYFTYSTGTTHLLCYATSKNVYGPYTYGGKILTPVLGWTTHHSILEYKGKWYLFYHDCERSNGINQKRNVKFRELTFNADGTIQTMNGLE